MPVKVCGFKVIQCESDSGLKGLQQRVKTVVNVGVRRELGLS